MLNLYIREFIGVGSHLEKKQENVRNDFILIEKEKLVALLDKNRFDTADNKIRIWKKLGWIQTDKDRHMTKRVYVPGEGYRRFVSISRTVLRTLRELNGE